jgi:hypothetical protein
MLATSAATTVLCLGLAFGTIAALFLFGARARIQPPDPNWRDHQPPSTKAPRSYWITWWIGFALLVSIALAASLAHQIWLAWLAFAGWVVTYVVRLAILRQTRRVWEAK